jgi:hypothetical protein
MIARYARIRSMVLAAVIGDHHLAALLDDGSGDVVVGKLILATASCTDAEWAIGASPSSETEVDRCRRVSDAAARRGSDLCPTRSD